MNRFIILLWLVLVYCNQHLIAQEIYYGSLTLTSQAEVDGFHYDYVTSNLTISNYNGDISDLSPLSSLDSVGMHFQIEGNKQLNSLQGLNNLVKVKGNFAVYSNNISSLLGLSNLYYVGGWFEVTGNTELISIEGLESVNYIGDHFYIGSHDKLGSLDGLQSINQIEHLSIANNSILTNYCALVDVLANNPNMSLTCYSNAYNPTKSDILNGDCNKVFPENYYVGNLIFNHQTELDTLNAKYNHVTGYVYLHGYNTSGGESINNLLPLSNIQTVRHTIDVQGLFELESLEGLHNVTKAGGINLYNLWGITSLAPLANIDSLGWLQIQSMNRLKDLTGLHNLSHIDNGISIRSNYYLNSFEGLDKLKTITGHITITENPGLTSLGGIDVLNEISGYVKISNNRSLWNYCGLAGHLLTMPETNLTISDNFYNPSTVDFQNGDCSGSYPENWFIGNLTFANQEQLDTISEMYNYITGDLRIFDRFDDSNNEITDLSALSNIDSIGYELNLFDNYSLASLQGLNNLKTVNKGLDIDGNYELKSLDGLENITILNEKVYIYDNVKLIDYCAISDLVLNNEFEWFSIYYNKYNPTFEDFSEGNCSDPTIDISLEINNNTIQLYPNPANKIITLGFTNNVKTKVKIINIKGEVLFEKIVFSENMSIDVSNFAEGLYIIETEQNQRKKIQKLSIQ